MSIEGFDYKEQWIGTDDISAYDFSFKIFKSSQLRFYIQDYLGNILADNLDGTDTTWLSNVTFDTIKGGGTVYLVSPLPANFTFAVYLANDAPDQPTLFASKASFSMEIIEGALDYLAAALQRVAFLAQRSIRLHDLDDIGQWDTRLPVNLSAFPLAILTINANGTGFALGPTTTVLNQLVAQAAASALAAAGSELNAANSANNAQASANAAASSANSAELSAIASAASAAASAASAAQAAGTGFLTLPEINCPEGGSTDLFTLDPALYKSCMAFFEVERGITVLANGSFNVQRKNGAWRVIEGPYSGDDTGILWVITGNVISALVDTGAGNAKIIIKQLLFKKP